MIENAPAQAVAQSKTESAARWAPAAGWQAGLPVLQGSRVALREVARADAASLSAMIGENEVVRFTAQFPSTVEGFSRYIESAIHERSYGGGACFAVVPAGCTQAVGLIRIRLSGAGGRAEWSFAINPQFWGLGIFQEASELAVRFAFDTLGACRLEARVATGNGRGNGALSKLGAVQEAILPNSLVLDGRCLDEALWTIVNDEGRCYRNDSFSLPRIH